MYASCCTDLPDSPEAYWWRRDAPEGTGRKPMLSSFMPEMDRTALHKRIADTFPPKEYILDVYEHLQYYYQMAMGDGFHASASSTSKSFAEVQILSPYRCTTRSKFSHRQDISNTPTNKTMFRAFLSPSNGTSCTNCGNRSGNRRTYTGHPPVRTIGVFTWITYISEETLHGTYLARQQVYNILVMLTWRRIVDYIPRKRHHI